MQEAGQVRDGARATLAGEKIATAVNSVKIKTEPIMEAVREEQAAELEGLYRHGMNLVRQDVAESVLFKNWMKMNGRTDEPLTEELFAQFEKEQPADLLLVLEGMAVSPEAKTNRGLGLALNCEIAKLTVQLTPESLRGKLHSAIITPTKTMSPPPLFQGERKGDHVFATGSASVAQTAEK